MKKYKLHRDAIANDKRVWIGIDAHKQSLHFTVIDECEVLSQTTTPNAKEHVRAIIGRLPNCEIVAVYESGPTGYSLLYWLEELGCEAFITPASKVPEQKGGKQIKTDERDSRELAELARAGLLGEVYDLGEEAYCQRELTRTRQQHIEHRTRVCAQIKSKLLFHGIKAPEELKQNWSKSHLHWLEAGPSTSDCVNIAVKSLVATYRHLTVQIRRLKKEIDQLAKSKEFSTDVELLTSVPGVGVLTAMIVLLELGDITRFDRCEELSSFLGLIPGEWSSGERQKKGSCVRWGNKRARTALVEASWTLIGKDPRMRKTYERIKYRRGSGRAIVAVARRLGLALRAMLRERQPYDYEAALEARDDHSSN